MQRNWDEYHQAEKPALDLFEKLGYDVYDFHADDERDRPLRESEHHVILQEELRDALKRINPWINENNLNKAVNKIRPARIKATDLMEANEIIYQRLVKHISLTQDLGQGKKNQTVKYIDYDNPENNQFTVMNQFAVKGRDRIKPDIVVFVNGIPLAVIECKNKTTINEPEEEAITQLRRYQNVRDGEEGAEHLFYPNQILVTAWGNSASAATVGAPARVYKPWKDPYPYSKEEVTEITGFSPNLQNILLFSLFKKDRFLDYIRNFIVFEREGNSMVKMAARYQQYRAVVKAMERIKNADSPDDRSGTVWHTQGSGKSLTMLFLALKLKRFKEIGNPTILIVTDRVDLDEQITGTFKRCGFPNPKRAESVENLKELLTSDVGRTVMTTIHKFQDEEREKYPVLSEDESIFVMADEAHRTQFKELAANMRRALPNAAYLGFTGTPIDKESKSTLRTFGDYIDTYTIEESVDDETTLPIKYESRLAELHLEDSYLDESFERVFSDYSEEEKKKIKEKYATERDIAQAPKRIRGICHDIIDHYEKKIKPLKGQIVTVSRRAAVRYKKILDELNGPESVPVISGDNNDEGLIKKYSVDNAEKSEIVSRFKDYRSSLKFVIVCNMLITGFDAPVEQVMYLDKPLKEHNLLQAIARVNRPFPDKNYGLVVDYYGVFDDLQKALAIFSSKDVENAVTPIRDEKPRLESNYRAVMKLFEGVDMDDLDACVKLFEDEEKRAEFKNKFKAFSKSMDIIMPAPIADPYRKDLKKLGKIYRAVRNTYRDDSINIKGAGKKVRKLIDNHVSSQNIKRLYGPVSILDEQEFDEVMEEIEDEEAKAIEMEHAIKKELSVRMEENPALYQSLSERLEEIIERRKEKQMSFCEQLEEMEEIVVEMRTVKTKAEKLGFNQQEYALYELLLQEQKTEKEKEEGKEKESDNIKLSEPTKAYTAEGDGLNIDEKMKKLTENIMDSIEEYTEIDLWKEKSEVQKKMRKEIKINLCEYEEFKSKLDGITTQIMKLARKVFVL
ncbi:type I restriction endonuclease subunit R [Halarsenatibacter silvermanii]|uniref:Type I restriction enzyme endonuclease subunit n=1 Tax=Halarsenatibacter silvermanii TaxID=321763 RepID=A0A1G9M3Z2_9FIRM|nr:type I restriction endonuclease subunit R [Halarsenatibacter silvermanii]SDL68833.1 type I restriction enzyme, R subunit [Halarsenatibacter silvermanii]